MMDGDPGDFDADLEEPLPDLEDSDMEDLFFEAPEVDLSDVFGCLESEYASPEARPRRVGDGWTFGDLGGEGVSVEDIFGCVEIEKTPPSSVEKAGEHLRTVEWDDLQTMNPSKIFALAIEYIVRRSPKVTHLRRNKPGKVCGWRYELAKLAKDPMRDLKRKLTATCRGDAYYTMTAWVSRLSGRSVRVVQKEMHERWNKKPLWRDTDDKVKSRWDFLRQLEKEPLFRDDFPELFERKMNGRSTRTSMAVVATSAQPPLPVTLCYGYMATYNTSLGLQDPEIMQWVQQGLSGQELAEKLKGRDLLKSAFARFVTFQKALAEKHHFKTWAVALEHSANAQHPARVHLHVYAGVDIRGGHVLMGMPLARPVSKASLDWPGCAPPNIRFTIVRRPSPATILNGVSTGMYYVAGAKKSNLHLEASMHPFVDRVGMSLCSARTA